MADPEIPSWLKTLPLAPEYRPTETEFSDPISFISRIEREAAAFGICKVIPPLPKPSRRFVLSNLNRSLAKSPELGPGASPAPDAAAVFTTRHQELGSRRTRPPPLHKQQVWQSGEVYTLEQFEAKSKAFSRAQLAGSKEATPLLVESLFWKAAAEKPIYVEYANDVPGSGFSVPDEENSRSYYYSRRWKKQKRGERMDGPNKCPCPVATSDDNSRQQKVSGSGSERETAVAGLKLSNSSWNLQVIARSPGSLTRFMPDEVPGVTSPMVYIGMLFSWFAWHVEDHELHSLNFLHMGSPKTWYAVPGEYASAVEEIVRVQGYGGNMDRLAAFTMLGEKTTLMSPEVFVASGVPCCRLVQNPGEFVVTFPRAYHVGFSHGFNCGEAANFATPQWLKVAKDAAVRRAAMNYLPMLSHQQLLYMLTMSFVSRVPRSLLPGVRSSRLKDRRKEEREILVKKAFLKDMMNENHRLCALLANESTFYAVLWEPELLPSPCTGSQSLEAHGSVVNDGHGREIVLSNLKGKTFCVENELHEVGANLPVACDNISSIETLEGIDVNEDDLPFGLNVDSGSLACVSCGVLGYPFMAIVQPSERALKGFCPVDSEEFNQKSGGSGCLNLTSCLPSTVRKLNSGDPNSSCMLYPALRDPLTEGPSARSSFNLLNNDCKESTSQIAATFELHHSPGNLSTTNLPNNSMNDDGCGHISRLAEHQLDHFKPLNMDDRFSPDKVTKGDWSNKLHTFDRLKEFEGTMHVKDNTIAKNDSAITNLSAINKKWNTSNQSIRPRIFCLRHALEIEELLRCKGGANVLIVCHSDYVKIKAHAMSIAEEIGTKFNYKDVPLENASPEDLDILNVSIDDEEHNEHGEDWTSKLGLNLRYCVDLRKQSSPNQQQLTSALGGLFSEPSPVSVVSSLKWRSRRSRTPYKVINIVQSKPTSDANIEKGEPVTRNSNGSSTKGIQVYHSRKSGRYVNKEVEKNNADSLLTIPILIAKNPLMHQDGGETEEFKMPHDADLANSEDLTAPANSSAEVCKSLIEIQPKELNGVMTACDPVKSLCTVEEPSKKCKVDYPEDLHEVPVAWAPNFQGSFRNSMLSDNQSVFPVLPSSNFDMQLEVRVEEEHKTDDTVYSSEMQQELHCGSEVEENGKGSTSEMHQELPVAGEMDDSSKFSNSAKSSGPLVECFEKHSESWFSVEVNPNPAADDSAKPAPSHRVAVHESVESRKPTIVYKSYVRRNKRKREEEAVVVVDGRHSCSTVFTRSPCEGLRPRTGRTPCERVETKTVDKMAAVKARKKAYKEKGSYECDLEGCHLRFRKRAELLFHKRNRCTYKGCRKRFSSHRNAARHQRRHDDDDDDERPLKCPWKGCNRSFKWAWARTEHVRLHTGERPYMCKFAGCGLTFRFISEFSRHRRKTGHFVGS